LPKLVWQHNWQEGRRQGGQVKMWDAHTREVAEAVGMEELAAVCHAADSYVAYKKRVSMAVREREAAVSEWDCSCCSSQRAGHKAQQEAGDCFQPVSLLWAW
jgi:hypothetical protein